MSYVPNVPEYYKDHEGRWRWRIRNNSGQIYDGSHQSFYSKWNAKRNFKRTRKVREG